MKECDNFNFLITLCHLHERVNASGPHLDKWRSIEDKNDPHNWGSSSMHVICVFNKDWGSNKAGIASSPNQFINQLNNNGIGVVLEHSKNYCTCACSHGMNDVKLGRLRRSIVLLQPRCNPRFSAFVLNFRSKPRISGHCR